MRYILVFFLTLSFIPSIAGGDYPTRVYIDIYEPNLNIQYIGIEDTIRYADEKNKIREVYATSNIAAYSISKDSVNYIFKDTIKRNITHFYFETGYLPEQKTIVFNNEYHPDRSYNNLYTFSNNRNIERNTLSNSLIIVTSDPQTDLLSIWTSDKQGNHLKKLFEIDHSWNWEIDVKNQQVRISRQVDSRIEIKNEKY